ncbi:hypothetical protein QBC39DRAFT_342193 [Podospora conica]|nr:hypothetical protein QBC39DRAFT_342193 [Schizothecium conicum]
MVRVSRRQLVQVGRQSSHPFGGGNNSNRPPMMTLRSSAMSLCSVSFATTYPLLAQLLFTRPSDGEGLGSGAYPYPLLSLHSPLVTFACFSFFPLNALSWRRGDNCSSHLVQLSLCPKSYLVVGHSSLGLFARHVMRHTGHMLRRVSQRWLESRWIKVWPQDSLLGDPGSTSVENCWKSWLFWRMPSITPSNHPRLHR